MFRKLCGESTFKNVVVVTNMWGDVDPRVGSIREAELREDDMFFKPLLGMGAQMARHENTAPSAQRIIRLLLNNHPLPLRIQEELVTEGKKITETSAAEELNRELYAQIRKYQEELEMLKEILRRISAENKELKEALEIKARRMEEEIEMFQKDRQMLESEYEKEKEMLNARVRRMESEAKKRMEYTQGKAGRGLFPGLILRLLMTPRSR